MADDEEVAAKAFAAIRSTIEKTALRLATLPKESRAEQLLLVRTTHEDSLRDSGYDPTVDPGKAHVDRIITGLELLLTELDDRNATKN